MKFKQFYLKESEIISQIEDTDIYLNADKEDINFN